MLVFELIAERRIAQAIERGELADLPGAGRPLDLSDDPLVPEDLRLACRILKTAGFVPPELETRQAKRFSDLFALYRKNKQHITSVTFWGVSDDQTWLDNEPVPGRNDYPLLYNDAHAPKAARAAIMNF